MRAVEITLKLYAGLGSYLPSGASGRETRVAASAGVTPAALLRQFNIPPASVHLLLLNGIYVEPGNRDGIMLTDGDVLAVWPPVAGG